MGGLPFERVGAEESFAKSSGRVGFNGFRVEIVMHSNYQKCLPFLMLLPYNKISPSPPFRDFSRPLIPRFHYSSFFQHHFQSFLTPRLSLGLSTGTLFSLNSYNNLFVGGNLHYTNKKWECSLSTSSSSDKFLTCGFSFSRQISSKTKLQAGIQTDTLSLSRKFIGVQHGKLRVRSYINSESSLSTQIAYQKGALGVSTEFRNGVQHAYSQMGHSIQIGFLKFHIGASKSGNQDIQLGVQLDIALPNKTAFIIHFDTQGHLSLGLKRQGFSFVHRLLKWSLEKASWWVCGIYLGGLLSEYILGRQEPQKKKQPEHKKTLNERRLQLKLISLKANENYELQRKSQGLLINQAFYGLHSLLQSFRLQLPWAIQASKLPQQQVIDVTIPLRYYTRNGKIRLPGQIRVDHLLGLCEIEGDEKCFLVRAIRPQGERVMLLKPSELSEI